MVGVVVPAAGRGTRFGSSRNKIWAEAAGKPLIEWTLVALSSHAAVDHIVVVGNAADLDRLSGFLVSMPKVMAVVLGGESRAESVLLGLKSLPHNTEYALVHDAARPLVSAELISETILSVRNTGASVPGLAVSDTLKRVDERGTITATVSRDKLYAVQTPQAARLDQLLRAYEKLGNSALTATDEATILEAAGETVHIVPGCPQNIKVTNGEDLANVERTLRLRNSGGSEPTVNEVRTGLGYDVHQLVSGRKLWLGGVQVPHTLGLLGHSDADVVLHAICDAVLGAMGQGDIGVLFPDTDAAHKDRPSIEFVREVAQRAAAANWSVTCIDAALLAEAPKIAPYRAQMRGVIAAALDIDESRVNLKATTSEQIGFVGRQEGMACWCTATICYRGSQ